MGVCSHFGRSARATGEVNGHGLIVSCLHTCVVVSGTPRKEELWWMCTLSTCGCSWPVEEGRTAVILHIKHRRTDCRHRKGWETIHSDRVPQWSGPQWFGLNSRWMPSPSPSSQVLSRIRLTAIDSPLIMASFIAFNCMLTQLVCFKHLRVVSFLQQNENSRML